MIKVNADAIPAELKIYKQWVNWKYEQREEGKKPTKVPYSPKTKYPVSVMNNAGWGTIDEALQNLDAFDGIGFVLTTDDPYCAIDLDQALDDEQYALVSKIYADTRSYTEFSPSGTGMHIICKAQVGRGRKRHPVEVYDRARFITFTGNVAWALPIDYRQREVEDILSNMPQDAEIFSAHNGLAPEAGSDREIWDRAASAKNGQKFQDLWNGQYMLHYSSQSEADFALVDILAFYTQNAAQIERLFKLSGLGQREKAHRADYMDRMIRRSFDNLLPPIDTDAVQEMVKIMLARQEAEKPVTVTPPTVERVDLLEQAKEAVQNPAPAQPTPQVTHNNYVEVDSVASDTHLPFPEGLVGEIADYIYRSSPRPVREISLAAALGLMAGICGSAFNVSNTGLNLYLVTLAPTGTGKEALQSGISRLMENVRAMVPAAPVFIGAGEFASPQALITYLQKKSKNFVSVIGECGMWLKTLSDPLAHERHSGLRRLLLDLYGKSGQRSVLHPTAYADSLKNADPVKQPAVTLLGESTAARFFECIDETLIAEGFVPRWLIIEYEGERPPSNRNHAQVMPHNALMQGMVNLTQYALQMIDSLQSVHVGFTAEAQQLEMDFDVFCDAQINATGEEALRNLWSRVHMKVLKVAALIAVGKNLYTPVIDTYCWNYAKDLVLRDTNKMCRRYNQGLLAARIVAANTEQHNLVLDSVRYYMGAPTNTLESYGVTPQMRESMAIPYTFFHRKLARKAAFQKDRRGSAMAIQRALDEAANTGLITLVPQTQSKQTYMYSGKLWVISDYKQLTESEE